MGVPPQTTTFVALDVETSGHEFASPEFRLLEIGACRFENGRPTEKFQKLLTGTEETQQRKRLNGLTEEDIRQAVPASDALGELAEFRGKDAVVAHNGVGYDFPILDLSTKKTGRPPIVGRRLDSLELAVLAAPRSGECIPPNVNGSAPPSGLALVDLCDWLGVPRPNPRHRALPDAEAAGRVVLGLLEILNEDCPVRNLQRRLLHRCRHPWAAFLAPGGDDDASLESVLTTLDTPPLGMPPNLEAAKEEDETRGSPFDLAEAVAPLGSGGTLLRGERRHRPEQEQMALEVAKTLEGKGTALIEAPTGTGKTLAYVVPSLAFSRSGDGEDATLAVSMHTKVLQDQVVSVLMELQETQESFTWTALKGANNYLSLPDLADELAEMDELDELAEGTDELGDPADLADELAELDEMDELAEGADLADEDAPDVWALAVIVGWVFCTPVGDWDDLSCWLLEERAPDFSALRWRISCGDAPRTSSTRLEQHCFHRRAVQAISEADIAVVNHAVLLSNRSVREEITHLICDEAHVLEDTASGAFTKSVSEHSLRRLFNVLGDDRRRGLLRRWREYLRNIGHPLDTWHPLGEDTEEQPDGDDGQAPREKLEEIRDDLTNAQERAETFGRELKNYLLTRAATSGRAAVIYGVEHRIKPGFDTRSSAYQSVLKAGGALGDALWGVVERLNRLSVPHRKRQLTEREAFRRRRLEYHIASAGSDLREAARVLNNAIWAKGDDEIVNLAVLEPTSEGKHEPGRRAAASTLSDQGLFEKAMSDSTWTLNRTPIDVSAQLREIWRELDAVVLTSATLQVGGSFHYVVERLGLTVSNTLSLESPFRHVAKNLLVVLPGHLPLPRGSLLNEFEEAAAEELARLFILTGGGGMGLFTARSRMLFARDHLRGLMDPRGIEVLCQGEQAAMKLIERMRTRNDACLLGNRSFWEGVDVPGEALRLLAIEKLPFPKFSDPLVAARMERLELRGGDGFSDYLVPRAVLDFAQGAGRLIRTETDRGALVVLDKRLRLALSYSEDFLKALPAGCGRMSPSSGREGYEAIAEHIGARWDEETHEELAGLPSAGRGPSFDDLRLSAHERFNADILAERLEVARERMGVAEWRPMQRELMLKILEGRGEDILAVLPTGSGKSLIFQLPAALLPGVTLVTSPLIALMRDQVETLRQRGYNWVAAVYSGQTQTEQIEILKGVRSGRYRLLYVSPERLWMKSFRTSLESVDISLVVVDEAHCISTWGRDFRPEYSLIERAVAEIIAARTERPPIAALTATTTERARKDITGRLGLQLSEGAVTAYPDRPELLYYTEDCESFEVRRQRVLEVFRAFRGKSAIFYVPRRKDAGHFASLLRADGHAVLAYHAGLETQLRKRTEEAFFHGDVDVIVSTSAFGMGIDKPDIELVLHLEMPQSIEDYVQETGRAGRGAAFGEGPATGTCLLLRTPRDCRIHGYFAEEAAPEIEQVQSVWEEFKRNKRTTFAALASGGSLTKEDVGASLLLLEDQGNLRRAPARISKCALQVPPDWRERMEKTELEASEKLVEILETLRRFGGEPFSLSKECERNGWNVDQAEELLNEADLAEIVSLRAWEYSVEATDLTNEEPDWIAIQASIAERRESFRERSKQAKALAHSDAGCRRARMLQYLGAEAPERCDACDVCEPDLPRPWQEHRIDAEQLAEAVAIEPVIRALLKDLEGENYSRQNLIRTLLGNLGSEAPARLREHRLCGALAHCERSQLEEALEKMIEDKKVEEVERSFEDDGKKITYISLRLRD